MQTLPNFKWSASKSNHMIFKVKDIVIIIFFYKIYSLCKNNAISKVLNKLQVFHFRCTVHTNTTPTWRSGGFLIITLATELTHSKVSKVIETIGH